MAAKMEKLLMSYFYTRSHISSKCFKSSIIKSPYELNIMHLRATGDTQSRIYSDILHYYISI